MSQILDTIPLASNSSLDSSERKMSSFHSLPTIWCDIHAAFIAMVSVPLCTDFQLVRVLVLFFFVGGFFVVLFFFPIENSLLLHETVSCCLLVLFFCVMWHKQRSVVLTGKKAVCKGSA